MLTYRYYYEKSLKMVVLVAILVCATPLLGCQSRNGGENGQKTAKSGQKRGVVPASCSNNECRGAAREKLRALMAGQVARGGRLSALFQAHSVSPALIDALALRGDDVVADIGCGTGAVELLLLEQGARFGRLYAVDIDRAALDVLSDALATIGGDGVQRLELIHSKQDDTLLPAGSCDVVFLLNTPFFVPTADEIKMRTLPTSERLGLESIRAAMKPDARFHVFDWKHDQDPVERASRLRWALENHGFVVESADTIMLGNLRHNHFVLTRRADYTPLQMPDDGHPPQKLADHNR